MGSAPDLRERKGRTWGKGGKGGRGKEVRKGRGREEDKMGWTDDRDIIYPLDLFHF